MKLLKKYFSTVILIALCATISLAAGLAEIPITSTTESAYFLIDSIYNEIRNSPLPNSQYNISIVSFTNEGYKLEGTLTTPQNEDKCPIVITLNGFIGNRDEEAIPEAGETVYERLCKILAGHGIASLRLDCRGYGNSDGTFDMVSFSSQVSDIKSTIDFICTNLRYRVDAHSIGILGFSQGALVAAVAGSKFQQIDSLVLWSPPAHPPICYEGLLTKEGIKQGLMLAEGQNITLGLYLENVYLGLDVTLGRNFFKDLFSINPVAAIKDYKNPLMVVCGINDNIVWPQPQESQNFLDNHDGIEKLVLLNADHEFDYWDGPDAIKLNDAIFWSTAWFIKTLKD